jgi:hypothetical protein
MIDIKDLKTAEIVQLLKDIGKLNYFKLNQKELLEIYNKEKVNDNYFTSGTVFKHHVIKPSSCPNCGNWRLDIGGEVFECPQGCHHIAGAGDNILELSLPVDSGKKPLYLKT